MPDVFSRLKEALADRYTIEREIGAGGMATVYLAEDMKHRRRVAVKVLRPELAATLGPERFLREIEVAARLTHPHILPLHDSGEAGGFLYYVMPYIEGESLRERLAREGSLPVQDAVKIVREIVDALASAHREGVVHRDVKPDNVMLSQDHAMVTDFGVAKAVSEATGREKLTTAGIALGTPSYMAPEQASADTNIDHRADIYAIGAVAYELLAGRPPFAGSSSQAILAAHVTETPDPVTDHRAAVPPALANLVMRCLEKNRADRWQSAEELLPQLEALVTPSGGITPTQSIAAAPARPSRTVARIAAAVGLVGVVGLAAVLLAPRGADSGLVEDRVLVAVFDNETGDESLDHVGKILADWLARGLQQIGGVEVADPRMALAAVDGDGAGGVVSNRELAERASAGMIVSGAYYETGDSLQIQASLVATATGNLIASLEPVSAPVSDPLEAGQLLADQVMAGVARVVDNTTLVASGRFAVPRSYAAWREYVTGREIWLRVSPAEALPHLLRAMEIDSTFIAPAVFVASYYGNVGRWAEMDSVVQRLRESRDRLTESERLIVNWLDGRARGNLTIAYRAVRSLDSIIVGDATFNFLHGRYAVSTNRLFEAAEVLSRQRFPDWNPYWNDLTTSLHLLGEHERELEEARAGREAQPDHRLRLDNELRALVGLGRVDQVLSAVNQIMTFPSGAPGSSLRNLALELAAHGYTEDARELSARALDWYRQAVADDPENAGLRYNLGWRLYENGLLQEAAATFETLAYGAPEDEDYIGSLGVTMAALGRMDEATSIERRLGALETPYLRGRHTRWRARIAAVMGDRERAVALLREAHREGVAYGAWLHTDPTLDSLRGFGQFEEFVRPRR